VVPTFFLALLASAGALAVFWAIRPVLFSTRQPTAVDERMAYYGTDVNFTDDVARLSFRERMIQPAVERLSAAVAQLTPQDYMRRLEHRLEESGRPSGLGAVGFIVLRVAATLVAASLSVYQRFERQLSPKEQERYYQEMSVVAQLFGTPASVLPATLGEFREYFDAQIAGDTLVVTRTAKEIGDVILEAPLPTLMRLFAPAHRLATAAQLPPRLCREYDLHWGPLHALTLPLAARSLKLTAWPVMLAASKLTPEIRAAAA